MPLAAGFSFLCTLLLRPPAMRRAEGAGWLGKRHCREEPCRAAGIHIRQRQLGGGLCPNARDMFVTAPSELGVPGNPELWKASAAAPNV